MCHRDTCTLMFITEALIIVKSWIRPRFPSTDELIKSVTYIHSGILFIFKEEWSYICNKIYETWDYLKWNKPHSERQVLHVFLSYMEL